MKSLSTNKLAETVKAKRIGMDLNQEKLSKLTGINRALISRIERQNFIPSIGQFEKLADVLSFEITEMFIEKKEVSTFVALRSEALNNNEIEGVENLFTMMLSLRQQILIRSKFDNEGNN